jgi:hypothetical protein
MSGWDYAREEKSNTGAGDHRFEVVSAEEKNSKTGKRMIVIGLKPNGAAFTVNDYIVKNEYFNRNMTSFFDATNIEEGNFNLLTWVGAMGAARFKEDENGFLKRAYYLDPKRAEKLPAWVGPVPERQTVTSISGMEEVDDELPFPMED